MSVSKKHRLQQNLAEELTSIFGSSDGTLNFSRSSNTSRVRAREIPLNESGSKSLESKLAQSIYNGVNHG